MYPIDRLCPCKGCTERLVGCHSTCNRYLEWRKDRDQEVGSIKNKHQRERSIDNALYEMARKKRKRY